MQGLPIGVCKLCQYPLRSSDGRFPDDVIANIKQRFSDSSIAIRNAAAQSSPSRSCLLWQHCTQLRQDVMQQFTVVPGRKQKFQKIPP